MAPLALPPERDLFAIDNELFNRPDTQKALQAGQLVAKQSALTSANRLVAIGRPLSIGVIAVSFIHLWDRIASIRPAGVAELVLNENVYHGSSGLLTFFVDAVALYLVATRAAAHYTGRKPKASPAIWFFYTLTALLNFSFVLANSAMPEFTKGWLTGLNFTTAIMLALLIPVSIAAIESAMQVAQVAKLKLMVEVEALTQLLKPSEASPAAIADQPTQSSNRIAFAPLMDAHELAEAHQRKQIERHEPSPAGVEYAWPDRRAGVERRPAFHEVPLSVVRFPIISPEAEQALIDEAHEAADLAPAQVVRQYGPEAPEAKRIEPHTTDDQTSLNELVDKGIAWVKERLKEGAELNAEIVRLKDDEGMTYPQIAKELELSSADNARSRYRAAKGTK